MNALALLAQQPNDGGAGAVVGGFLGFMAIIWILAIAATVFWVWMLVDVLVSNRDTNDKIPWFLVVFFLHFVGALIYFFVARRRGTTMAPA
jgi:uncharacterized RDD family membrane protein YckC